MLSSVPGVPGCPAQSSIDHRGTLMVAEVASRFEDTHAFLKAMTQLGFRTVSKVCPRVCPQVCLGLGTECTRNQGGSPRRGCIKAQRGADQGLVKVDRVGEGLVHGRLQMGERGTSMHRGGVLGEGFGDPGDYGGALWQFGMWVGWGAGAWKRMRGAWSTLGL